MSDPRWVPGWRQNVPQQPTVAITTGFLTGQLPPPWPYTTTSFAAGGTFTTPANSTTGTVYRYRMVGAGGGGGGANGAAAGAGGGGGGCYAEGYFSGVAASTGVTITVGTGGTGGTALGGNGGVGGATSIGAPVSVTCGGGNGGTGSTAAGVGTVAAGGGGGTLTSGSPTLSFTGQAGQLGIGIVAGVYTPGGDGGGTGFGPGVRFFPNAGNTGVSPGSGGSGANSAGFTGGNGAAGLVLIDRVTP